MTLSIVSELQNLQAAQNRLLQRLHSELGYDSPQSLADAILQASNLSPPKASKPSKASKENLAAAANAVVSSGRRGRRVPDEVRDAIRAELKEGTVPGYNLAAKYNVSYNIVHAIKQELGLVKAHKKKRSRKA